MMSRKWIFVLIVFLTLPIKSYLQDKYVKDYFQPPLDIRLLLSGTFGEIRSNHFHSGIDIKTGGAEGAKVYAIADGYVSRIKVSAYGFGKALYVTHPNGYVSVYAHLSGYNDKIGKYVRDAQYARESFEIELFPEVAELNVRKGDVIAFTGNSGSSGGPHLHFEIRDEATQKPINPLLFGYEVKDFYKPRITSIKIYPESENARLNGRNRAVRYLVDGWGAEHKLNGNPTIRMSGEASFAIQVYDQQNDSDNKNGPYSITLYIDDKPVHNFVMETFSFGETRYVNSLLDYEEYIKNSVRLQRTKVDPGNQLSVYRQSMNKGVFTFDDTLTHKLRYEVRDIAGNTAVLDFKIKGETAKAYGPDMQDKKLPASKFPGATFNYAITNQYKNGLIIVDAPKGAFYDSFTFTYDTTRRIKGTYGPVHILHDKFTPIHEELTISLRSAGLPSELQGKALVVKINDDGTTFTSAGGKYERGGYMVTKIKEFGNYSIAVDTVPPVVKSLNPETFGKMASQKNVKIRITDELSGIAAYKGQINGKWVLMEYDAKNDLLIYTIDENLLPGKNTFLLEVMDGKNNKAFYSAFFYL